MLRSEPTEMVQPRVTGAAVERETMRVTFLHRITQIHSLAHAVIDGAALETHSRLENSVNASARDFRSGRRVAT